ncbi:MAG: sterol desaturase family protein [Methylococcales bacterium]|nr:sterol desaturase family protein [Methylococcales bacterium]
MELNRETLLMALPVLVLMALLEAVYLRVIKKHPYDWRESLTSLGVALGGHVLRLVTVGIVAVFAQQAWQHRLLTLSTQQTGYWPALFILEEFCYYWFHRFSHTCRWFWATHAVHHSPNHFYLSGAYRLGWTGPITGGFLFFSPLFLLGFKPESVFVVLGINLLYQYWLHTELIGQLGRFDRFFNSPANHRVHHASLGPYLDKNFGGVLMVFDHCFGTYKAEDNKRPISQYGVLPAVVSYNPITVVFHEWRRIGHDLQAASGIKQRFLVLFGRP